MTFRDVVNVLKLCLTPPGLWITLAVVSLSSILLYLRRKRVIQWLRRWDFIEFAVGPFTFGKNPVSGNEQVSESVDGENGPEFLENQEVVQGEMNREEDYAMLLELLRDRFQEQDLRTASFHILGPGSYDNLGGNTRNEKAISLIDALISRGKVTRFYEYVEEHRPDIDLSASRV